MESCNYLSWFNLASTLRADSVAHLLSWWSSPIWDNTVRILAVNEQHSLLVVSVLELVCVLQNQNLTISLTRLASVVLLLFTYLYSPSP